MKKIVLIPLALLFSINFCHAQISAPVQSDTLYITSMQYSFNDISKANWPFTYIIQTTTSFIVDCKEFSILEAEDNGYSGIYYTLSDGEHEYSLVKKHDRGYNIIEFSNYILYCSKKADRNSGENSFKLIAHQPQFQGGGPNEFTKWVNEHLKYPEIAKENGIQGRVTVQYTIDKQGRVTNVSVLRGVDPSLDKEAIRVVSSSPKWTPGKDEKGNPQDVSYTYPVIFQLQ